VFVVEEDPEGGYVARCLGESIVTQADTAEGVRDAVRDAVKCHFDDGAQRIVRLHFVRDEVFAA
jgi:urease gamma subunit